MEWIKITDVESIPLGVPMWVFYKKSRAVGVLHAIELAVSQITIADLCTHYMPLQAPPPPEED